MGKVDALVDVCEVAAVEVEVVVLKLEINKQSLVGVGGAKGDTLAVEDETTDFN